MNFKPEGLILPDCVCFQKHTGVMNKAIDNIASIICAAVCEAALDINICDKARDYYISCIVSDVLALLLKASEHPAAQEDKFKENYERIKPLVFQRLAYTGDRLENSGARFE